MVRVFDLKPSAEQVCGGLFDDATDHRSSSVVAALYNLTINISFLHISPSSEHFKASTLSYV